MNEDANSDIIIFDKDQIVGFLSTQELDEKIRAAKVEGVRLGEVLGEIRTRKNIDDLLERRAVDYYTKIILFAYSAHKKIEETVTAVKVLSARVRTSYTFNHAELLLVIESPVEQEFEVTKILNDHEKEFRKKEIDISSNFVNTSGESLNYSLMQVDYPTSLELPLIKNAVEKRPHDSSST